MSLKSDKQSGTAPKTAGSHANHELSAGTTGAGDVVGRSAAVCNNTSTHRQSTVRQPATVTSPSATSCLVTNKHHQTSRAADKTDTSPPFSGIKVNTNYLDGSNYVQFGPPEQNHQFHQPKQDHVYEPIDADMRRTIQFLVPSGADSSQQSFELISSLTSERDKLLAEVVALTRQVKELRSDRKDLVAKLLKFVETNAQLHEELDALRQTQRRSSVEQQLNRQTDELSSVETQLKRDLETRTAVEEQLRRENVMLEQRVEQLQRTAKMSPADYSAHSSEELVSGVREELQQVVVLALNQQRELKELREIVCRQNKIIQQRSHAVVDLIQLRQHDVAHSGDFRDSRDNIGWDSRDDLLQRQDAAVWTSNLDSNPLLGLCDSRDAFERRPTGNRTTPAGASSSGNVGVGTGHNVAQRQLDNIVHDRRGQQNTTTNLTADARPCLPATTLYSRPQLTTTNSPQRVSASTLTQTYSRETGLEPELAEIPAGFEMMTACPICNLPIPFDASSSAAFSRHVDECISRVTRDGPTADTEPPTASAPANNTALPVPTHNPVNNAPSTVSDRVCPVCNGVFPTERYSQQQFEQHVDDHFNASEPLQFVPL